jgi:hypothetical protein
MVKKKLSLKSRSSDMKRSVALKQHHGKNQDYSLKSNGTQTVATPLWPSVGVKPNTPKVGDLESSGTPECLELDSKAQNTSH